MKKIINFAISNPVTIMMVVLAILLLGKISYDQLGVDLLPNLNNPKLFIELKAGERPPEEIEKQYVKTIESMATRQSDVTNVTSVIKSGSARVTVEYAWKKDMDDAFIELQKVMTGLSRNEDIDELKITQHDPNTAPVILVSLSSENITDMAELRKIADSYVRNELIRVDGVADVALSGDEETTLNIYTDAYRLKAFNLQIGDIANKISSNNQSVSGGRVSELGIQYLVKSSSVFNQKSDFEDLIVGYKPIEIAAQGNDAPEKAPIFLRDVATVVFENKRPENIVRINGNRGIGISVYKEMQFNTVEVVDAITEELDKIERSLPGSKFNLISNQGTFIKESIDEVKDSALMGILLAIVVLFIFLRRIGTTIIVSLAIPISIVATFNLMFFNGLTLNIMTLGGLALGAGMLVDNAIVVIESIFRNQERGMSVKEAAITGTSEVAGAVIASTLTTIVVFLPIVYLHGSSGELFKDQAWTVTFSLVSSLFVAIIFIPMLYELIFKKSKTKTTDKTVVKDGAKNSLQLNTYGRLLNNLIAKRWVVIGLSIALIIGTTYLVPYIGTEFMPSMESNTVTLKVKLKEGTRLERTASTVENIENIILNISGDSLCKIYSHVGAGYSSAEAIFEGENTASMKIILSENAEVSQEFLVAQLGEATKDVVGLEITVSQEENSISSLMGSEGAPIVVEIKGEELDDIAEITEEVKLRMLEIKDLNNVTSSIEDGAPELNISINRTIAGINNLSVSTIINQLKQQLTGEEAGKMEYNGELRTIIVKVPEVDLRTLGELTIKNGQQEFILNEIATITHTNSPREILRRNNSRIAKVEASMNADVSLDKVAQEIRDKMSDIALPNNYTITVGGEEEKRAESMSSLMFALLLSVVLVYMVLASQFESLLHPFTILLTIPLAVVGAILLFFITNTTINMMGIIGMVMLVGIAVNNSIILVDRINQLILSGQSLTDAIVDAGQQRIRPIIMTSLTTILALLPLTFTFGEGASLRSPMAIAVIGGLVTSTVMSLMVIPCVYYILEQMKRRITKKKKA